MSWALLVTLGTSALILILLRSPIQQRKFVNYAAITYLAIGLFLNYDSTKKIGHVNNKESGALTQTSDEQAHNKTSIQSIAQGWKFLVSGLLLFAVEYLLAQRY